MERTLTVEDKIKRAEEIYARRHEQELRNYTTFNLQGKEKKNIKVFKKMIVQIIVCLLIYLCFYTIKNNNYIFSKDFTNKAREILSYDTNFEELYNNINISIKNTFKQQEEQNIGGSNENIDKEKRDEVYENSKDKTKIDIVKSENNEKEVEKKTEKEGKESDKELKQESEKENDKELDKEKGKVQENGKGNGSEEKNSDNESKESKLESTNNYEELSFEEQQINKIKNTTTFIKPVEGFISSKYGIRNPSTSTVPKNHTGTDIAANMGKTIISSTPGKVILASSQGDYGIHLKIQVGEVSVIYAHCSKLYVNQGDTVTQGQKIAEVGSTGNSTGPHLHFEIRLNEKTIDPEKILEL